MPRNRSIITFPQLLRHYSEYQLISGEQSQVLLTVVIIRSTDHGTVISHALDL